MSPTVSWTLICLLLGFLYLLLFSLLRAASRTSRREEHLDNLKLIQAMREKEKEV